MVAFFAPVIIQGGFALTAISAGLFIGASVADPTVVNAVLPDIAIDPASQIGFSLSKTFSTIWDFLVLNIIYPLLAFLMFVFYFGLNILIIWAHYKLFKFVIPGIQEGLKGAKNFEVRFLALLDSDVRTAVAPRRQVTALARRRETRLRQQNQQQISR